MLVTGRILTFNIVVLKKMIAFSSFYNALLKKCHEMGMVVNSALANNPTYVGQNIRTNSLEEHFVSAIKTANSELDLILIIMDGRNTEAYGTSGFFLIT